jgi:hypothetical protein
MLHRLLIACTALLIAAPCSAMVIVVADIISDRDIKAELLYAGSRGPVPALVHEQPAETTAPAVIEALGRWSYGGTVKYALAQPQLPPDGFYLIFVFNQPRRIQGQDLCSGRYVAHTAPAGPTLSVSAAFCLRDYAMSSAAGTIGADGDQNAATGRLVDAVVGTLFPTGILQSANSPNGG